MLRQVGLDDDALARGLLEPFDQRGFMRLEHLGNFLWCCSPLPGL